MYWYAGAHVVGIRLSRDTLNEVLRRSGWVTVPAVTVKTNPRAAGFAAVSAGQSCS